MIEVRAFHLLTGADEVDFLATDKRVQAEFAYRQPGLLRRTTAKSDDGEWVVIDLWESTEAADASRPRWAEEPVTVKFMSFVNQDTLRSARYTERD